jgi:hypothetical protein
VAWKFSYYGSPPHNPLVDQKYQMYNCSVGRACDPAMFISRVTNPSQPFISNLLTHIINPRCTTTMSMPRLTVSETENPESLLVTAQMSGDVELVEEKLLEVDWDTGLAFLIKRIQVTPMRGTLIFRGVFLIKQEQGEELKEEAPLQDQPEVK